MKLDFTNKTAFFASLRAAEAKLVLGAPDVAACLVEKNGDVSGDDELSTFVATQGILPADVPADVFQAA